MDHLRRRGKWRRRLLLLTCLLPLFFIQPSYADFINGGFEDVYTPSNANSFNPITGWTLTGYTFNGNATTAAPTSISNINLTTGTSPGGITDILIGAVQTINDYFLLGATPTPTLLLPIIGSQSVMVNLRSIDAPLTKSGTGAISGWASIGKAATSISQIITIQPSDVDPTDGLVHIRFIAAPVVQNPVHAVNQQPFIALQVNNYSTTRNGANPLFFQWSYAGQPGVPWKSLTPTTGGGTNPGSDDTYEYTNFQAFDIAPGNAFIHVGDSIELVALASGCSLGGHDGHVYIDGVQTSIPYALWVTSTGPISATPGDNITYTFTYTNTDVTSINNVQVVVNMPQQGTPATPPAASTTFVSVTTPTAGTSPSCTGTAPVTCNIGTLAPGQSGTFQLTVNIPSSWPPSTGPVNNGNYPISGQGFNPLLGPLVQTALLTPANLSNLVINTSGLPTSAPLGAAYSGTFTCSNIPITNATGDAPSASCDIANLPAGLSVSGCTISPSSASWSEPATIPTNQTVTCSVSGIPTTIGSFTATASTNASNNSDSTSNQASVNFLIGLVEVPATLGGSTALSPTVVCCGRPVILGPLPVPGTGPTIYVVTGTTGDAVCRIGTTATQTYLKFNAQHGSCTIVGTKDGVTSAPFTVVSP